MAAPAIIVLPHGLALSGVTTWALSLADRLARRGRPMGLLVHEPPAPVRDDHPFTAPQGVEIIRPGVPALGDLSSDVPGITPAYDRAVRAFADRHGGPVVLVPNLHGACFAAAAALTPARPDLVRLVAWQHSDLEHDRRLLACYEPVIARFVGVSTSIAARLRTLVGPRAADVAHIPYGVESPLSPAPRDPIRGDHVRGAGAALSRPLRLIYSGRVEHRQKRVLALAHLADELRARGVDHEIRVVGDGPAMADLRALARERRSISITGPVPPDRVADLLDAADVLVLPSRYEGLSVAMLEAMARGCVPVVARVESGAADAIGPGVSGELAGCSPDDDEPVVGAALADAVMAAVERGLPGLSAAAHRAARDRFSLESHASAVSVLFDAAAAAPARAWPADRPVAFGATPGATVPAKGAERLRAVLGGLAGRSIVLHGAGRHTVLLAHVLADSPARVVAIADDDRGRQGSRLLGWPVIAPSEAAAAGATDVVISSWMHETAVWSRRSVYERAGLAVHRLYGDESS